MDGHTIKFTMACTKLSVKLCLKQFSGLGFQRQSPLSSGFHSLCNSATAILSCHNYQPSFITTDYIYAINDGGLFTNWTESNSKWTEWHLSVCHGVNHECLTHNRPCISVREWRCVYVGPSLAIGRMCVLPLLLVFASSGVPGSECRRAHDHMLPP